MIFHCDSLTHSNGGCRNVVCCCKISGGFRLTGQRNVLTSPVPLPGFSFWQFIPDISAYARVDFSFSFFFFAICQNTLVGERDRQPRFRLISLKPSFCGGDCRLRDREDMDWFEKTE